jgi:Spy/CpxP family protein refolding chaperone
MNSTPTTGTRSVWLAAIALASVFAVGGACGVLADRVIFREGPRMFHERVHFAADPLLEVELSQEQREKIDAIFERHRTELDSVMRETEPKMRALADRMDREIDAILTPKQRERLKAARSGPRTLMLPPPGVPAFADGPMPGLQGPHILHSYPMPSAPGPDVFRVAPGFVRPLERGNSDSGAPPPPPPPAP